MKSKILMDLSELSDEEKMVLIRDAMNGGFSVKKKPFPIVHPDRKSSKHFYLFSVVDTLNLKRSQEVAMKHAS